MNKSTPPSDAGIKKPLILAIVLLLILLLVWHVALPFLGIAFVITAGVWALVIASIAVFCTAGLLFFILGSIGVMILSIFAVIWVVAALLFFPFLFPLLIPLLIMVLFIAYLRRRKLEKSSK